MPNPRDKLDIVAPPTSILAEPPVAVVDKIANKRGTRGRGAGLPRVPLHAEGQEIAAKHHYRPRDPERAEEVSLVVRDVKLFTIDEAFGGWQAASKTHFADGGIFDQIYQPGSE